MNLIHEDVCQIRTRLWAEIDERERRAEERAEEAGHEAKIQALIQRYNVPEEWLRDPESILFDVLTDPNMPEKTKLESITFEGLHLLRKQREARQSQSSEPSTVKGGEKGKIT